MKNKEIENLRDLTRLDFVVRNTFFTFKEFEGDGRYSLILHSHGSGEASPEFVKNPYGEWIFEGNKIDCSIFQFPSYDLKALTRLMLVLHYCKTIPGAIITDRVWEGARQYINTFNIKLPLFGSLSVLATSLCIVTAEILDYDPRMGVTGKNGAINTLHSSRMVPTETGQLLVATCVISDAYHLMSVVPPAQEAFYKDVIAGKELLTELYLPEPIPFNGNLYELNDL